MNETRVGWVGGGCDMIQREKERKDTFREK